MTLGGLALAVGILVDDATVEIENIHRNLAMGKPLKRAILDGAQQIAVPAFVADDRHQHRLPLGRLPRRRRPLPVHGHGAWPSASRDGELFPVAHAHPDARDVPAARRGRSPPGRPSSRAAAGFFGRVHHAFERALRGLPRGYVRLLDGRCTTARPSSPCSASPSSARGVWCRSWGATSSPASTPARSACTCSPRRARASRRPRSSSPRSRTRCAS